MSWSIAVVERELPLGFIDNWLFRGQDAGHSFLRFKDDTGRTFLEIHGRSLPRSGNAFAKIRNQICTAFTVAADALLSRPLKKGPRLYAEVLTDVTTMEVRSHGRENFEHPVDEGSRAEILCKLECCLRAAKTINDKEGTRYVFFALNIGGQNCNSVVAEMCDRMGVNLPETMRFATPGIKRDLEEVVPALTYIKPNIFASMGEIAGSIGRLLPQMAPDASSLKWLSELKATLRPVLQPLPAPYFSRLAA